MAGNDSSLQFHVARGDLTPRESVLLAGFANRKGTSRGTHRPLSTRAVAFRWGERAACLITNDLLELGRDQVQSIRAEIASRSGLPAAAILLHSIHTHSAPWMERGLLEANDRYVEFATERIIDTACRAADSHGDFRSASFRTGVATCPISARRELVIPESGPAYRRPDPAARNDRQVGILRIEDAAKNERSGDDLSEASLTLVNFACHPVVLGFDSVVVSPDYPGRAREVVEAAWGGTAAFLNGAAGNINPILECQTDPAVADRYGETLGETVLDARLHGSEDPPVLGLSSRTVVLPYRDRPITKAFIDGEVARKSGETTEFTTWREDLHRWGESMKKRIDAGTVGEGLAVEIAALRLGPAVLFFTQGELFISYQIALKQRLPGVPLFIAGYTNGEIGYIPDAAAFDRPGYETDMAYVYTNQPSPLTPEAEAIFLDAAEETIREVASPDQVGSHSKNRI